VAENPETVIPIAQPTGIAFDLPCFFCGYNLRTLATDGVCPECGQPVPDTLQHGWLIFADKRWLSRLRRGAAIMFCLPPPILVILAIGFFTLGGTTISQERSEDLVRLTIHALACGLALTVVYLWSLWLLTSAEPLRNGLIARSGLRIWVRRLALTCIALPFAFVLLGILYVAHEGELVLEREAQAAMLGSWILCVLVSAMMLLIYVRRIARRHLKKGPGRLITFLIWGFGLVIAPILFSPVLAMGAVDSARMRFFWSTPSKPPTSQAETGSQANAWVYTEHSIKVVESPRGSTSMPAVTANRPSMNIGCEFAAQTDTSSTTTSRPSSQRLWHAVGYYSGYYLACFAPVFLAVWLGIGMVAWFRFVNLLTTAIEHDPEARFSA
jgi:hypothetical protein